MWGLHPHAKEATGKTFNYDTIPTANPNQRVAYLILKVTRARSVFF